LLIRVALLVLMLLAVVQTPAWAAPPAPAAYLALSLPWGRHRELTLLRGRAPTERDLERTP